MPQKNKQYEPLILVVSTLVLLLILSFTSFSFEIGSFHSRPVNVLAEFKTKGLLEKSVPLVIFESQPSLSRTTPVTATVPAANPLVVGGIVQYGTDSASGLKAFFAGLTALGKTKKKIRIAYFGDSMIEGDLITQDLRNLLQNKFGGDGVGFMPVTSIVADYTLLDATSADHPLGITGHTFVPAVSSQADSATPMQSSWVKYSAVGRKHLNRFGSVHLYYGRSQGSNTVVLDGDNKRELEGKGVVNDLTLSKRQIQNFTAHFSCTGPVNIYGFTMEGDTGVVLDNYSFRGNSGMPMTKMPYAVLSGLNKYLQYDLIVLHYGVNVVNEKVTDFSWYQRGMTEVVRHFQNCFPQASILIIGAGDKATRIDGQYVTDPSLHLVVESQQKVAENTHTAFWNFYEAMGGEGSMVKWVTGDTVYAHTDYTHFNSRGANRVGSLLYTNLIREFEKNKSRE
jgi:lysophospholipase L1-like esterase